MQKKWLVKLNIIALIIISLVFVFMVWEFSASPEIAESIECVDVNKVASFVYDSCYDAYTKNIFLTIKREHDSYQLKSLEFSFFDFNQQNYKISDVPNVDQTKAYKLFAEKNPQNLYVKLNIVKDFSAPICEESRELFVKYCSAGIQQKGVNVSISLLGGVDIGDFVDITRAPKRYSDVFSLTLVEKEIVWQSQCESKWKCTRWEACKNGIQKRVCRDLKECFIPTDVPERVRYCDGTCEENWECSWSDCSSGFAIPTCKDLNKCGTSYMIPQKLNCNKKDGCTPDVSCDEWSNCEVDYSFIDLIQDSINDIRGVESRVCKDSNGCVETNIESRSCSVNVDVYTKRFIKCGTEFVGVYNKLNDELISRISGGTEDNPILNIYLDDNVESPYCDYCFDGVKDGDEEGIDCGGSCEGCSDKYRGTVFEEKNWWNNFINWFRED